MAGMLIAFEGLDQSGKETQAKRLQASVEGLGHQCRLLFFPDYETPIGREIGRGLRGEREFGPDVMQLLFIANRYERKPDIERWLAGGLVLICDRYLASSVAYGEGHGLDPAWLADVQKYLPQPHLTILLDIAPETAASRKALDRDRYERDLALLARVRESYHRQARDASWAVVDASRPRQDLADALVKVVASRLAPL